MKDDEELRAFLASEHSRLARTLTLVVGDRAVADELAQEALVRVVADWRRVREMASPGGWAHHVALNLAKSALRRRAVARRAASQLVVDEGVGGFDAADGIVVREALAALPTRQRQAVALRHVGGWSAVEIGQILGCSDQAARNLVHRGVAALRAQLADLRPSVQGADDG